MNKIRSFQKYEPKFISSDPYLLIFFHGYGGCAKKIIENAPFLNHDNLIIVAPDAPTFCTEHLFRIPENPEEFGRKWFDLVPFGIDELRDNHSEELQKRIDEEKSRRYSDLERIKPDLVEFIESQMKINNIDYDHLILGGFSQGCMTAMHLGLTMDNQCKAILGLCGIVIDGKDFATNVKNHPEMLFLYGNNDDIIPIEFFEESSRILDKNNIKHKAIEVDELDHSLNLEVIMHVNNFLGEII